MAKNILITGIGGLTPRSIAKTIKKNHPDYKLFGCDINSKAVGFFIEGLLDDYSVCPRCSDKSYFDWISEFVDIHEIDYAFVQPEAEIIEWTKYYQLHNEFPCPAFLGDFTLSSSLRDKSIMADLLKGTNFIPKTIKITQDNPRLCDVETIIGFPCWVRATEGTGGLGSLKIENISSLESWLFINKDIPEFTVSEFLPGRHLANQMLYYNGEYIKGASLECVEYVMADTSPSGVTGNTHFGRLLNDDSINEFCDSCIKYLEKKINTSAHGILSFDLKEDCRGNLKVTEVNIRHMAYTGVMAKAGFDLIEDTINLLEDGNLSRVVPAPYYHFDHEYVFLRDVDIEPILLDEKSMIL